MSRWCIFMVVLLTCAAGLASCATSGPSVSGFGMGDNRTVSQGDEVVIRLPASADTGAVKWTLAEFDSRMLSLAQRPMPQQDANGRITWTCRFVARNPGRTEVVLRRTAVSPDAPGEAGERRRFRITIR